MSLRPRAHIHLSNIVDNWRTVGNAQMAGSTAAVIKADAYGHGLPQVAEALHDAGCDHFFVAHSHEAEVARATLGSHPNIYVLNGPSPDEEALYRENALIPVINSSFQFRTMADWLVDGVKMPRGYVLHFDTGMNRLGLPEKDVFEVAEAVEAQSPSLIMSHLACSEDEDSLLNAQQNEALKKLASAFPHVPLSLSNSGGVWLGVDYHHILTRPGIALYGGGTPPKDVTLKPGMTLEAPILQVRQIEAGETVGYGATWRAAEPTLIATLAIGYGDGFPRSASNKGFATLGGNRCPIIGRVSMDLITIDVTDAAELARPGVYAQLIGPDAGLEEQAALAGTIGYELTTGLTPRVKRIYES
ncbi:MAG: alanine racemase [Henriciella sp.]|nr:alanine racemase [Henriciella sp.]